ncbi:MAG: aminoacyl-tRNA hydrolase [Spirochaetota bacterium]
MKIVAFLGNPGRKYEHNRHNAGFITGKLAAEYFNIIPKKKEFHCYIGSVKLEGNEVLLIFPDAFMNSSGVAVNEVMRYYNVNPEDLIAVHDEIELQFGVVKIKFGGGHKGHNGIRSIIQSTGSADFNRIRIGVGRPPDSGIKVADYLLSDFSDEELIKIKELAPRIIQSIHSLIIPAP